VQIQPGLKHNKDKKNPIDLDQEILFRNGILIEQDKLLYKNIDKNGFILSFRTSLGANTTQHIYRQCNQ